jgi:hypothetical protein
MIAAPVSVIADAVFVLSSPRTFRKPRDQIVDLLLPLLLLPDFEVERRGTVLRALDL